MVNDSITLSRFFFFPNFALLRFRHVQSCSFFVQIGGEAASGECNWSLDHGTNSQKMLVVGYLDRPRL